jgi:galactose oxidase
MHWINTSGDGTVVGLGNRGNDGHAMNGNAIMYDINKILTVGGAPNYEDGPPTNNATLIDISAGPGKNVTSHPIAGMQYARKYGHSILLPNGQVVVAGGGGAGTHIFSDVDAVMPAELWDPETEKFRTLPAMSTPRTYHSIGFLMVDGRVMLAGGGLGVDFFIQLSPIHTDAEIYTPPYLLNADGTDATRPVIASAPSTATAGQYITVLSSGATSFTLIRASADTHSLNNDQRRIPLTLDGSSATKVSMTKGNDAVTLKIPDERGIVFPGTYYLFALDERGTPSMGWMMNIQ